MKPIAQIFAALIFLLPCVLIAQSEPEPPSGMNELEAYSVFVDAVKSDDYQMAISFGEWIIDAAPKELKGYSRFDLERQFDRMIDVYAGAAEQEEDPAIQTEYLNKAKGVFERFNDVFPAEEIDTYAWELKQGRFYQEHNSNMDATMEDAMAHYLNAYEEDPGRFTEEADGYYAELILTQLADRGERDRAFRMMEDMMPHAGAELETAMNDIRESLFEGPEERIEFYESQLADAEDSEKEELLANLRDLYDDVGNTERSRKVAMELYNLNPYLENTRAVAEIHLSDGNYERAREYLVEAVEKSENEEVRHDLLLKTSEAYQQTEQYEKAREYARDAIDINENSGDAYLRIASIYANTIRSCVDGSKLAREDRAVYWLVIDYLEQAERVDKSVASRARSQAESYGNAMPSDEDKFFNDWAEGSDFNIDGTLKSCYAWVNETTTVR